VSARLFRLFPAARVLSSPSTNPGCPISRCFLRDVGFHCSHPEIPTLSTELRPRY
jgi:hypothetical protein